MTVAGGGDGFVTSSTVVSVSVTDAVLDEAEAVGFDEIVVSPGGIVGSPKVPPTEPTARATQINDSPEIVVLPTLCTILLSSGSLPPVVVPDVSFV